MWPEIEKAKSENRHELVLTGKEISSRIDKDGLDISIYTLTGLNYLSLSETNLSEVGDNICNLMNLQTLVLHSNEIKNINENISKLNKLKMLDLSRNNIQSIPDSFANLPLVTLNLNVNKLESFPEFTKNTKLTVLDLSNNKLNRFPPICSEELINLLELKLHGNKIEEIPNKISTLPSLKLLDISDNKLKTLPGELADCQKLKDISSQGKSGTTASFATMEFSKFAETCFKDINALYFKELNLKANPISDRRLLKLIDQCRTKQVLDYVKQHCVKTIVNEDGGNKGKNRKKTKSKETDEEDNDSTNYKYSINVKNYNEDFKVVIMNAVKTVREHFLGCIVNNVSFTDDTFKRFIQLQNKLHDTVCDKRIAATIATHDFNKLPLGNLIYTTALPSDLMIKPLNRSNVMSGSDLFAKLQTEANNLRKEKKRSTYSGIHKYLYLIEGKSQYPCVLNSKNEVVSFPPITNSDISKIETTTTHIFIEVTSSVSQLVCKNVLNNLVKDMVLLFEKDLNVQQVRAVDQSEQLKNLYPSKNDLIFDKGVPIKICRE